MTNTGLIITGQLYKREAGPFAEVSSLQINGEYFRGDLVAVHGLIAHARYAVL